MTASIVADAEDWVKSELAGQDGSHDWWHIARVRATALSLAREESLPESSMLTVELAALLHDVRDWKYIGDANAGAEAVSSWLEDHGHTIKSYMAELATINAQFIEASSRTGDPDILTDRTNELAQLVADFNLRSQWMDEPEDARGCGCAVNPAPSSGLLAVLGALGVMIRRRR